MGIEKHEAWRAGGCAQPDKLHPKKQKQAKTTGPLQGQKALGETEGTIAWRLKTQTFTCDLISKNTNQKDIIASLTDKWTGRLTNRQTY